MKEPKAHQRIIRELGFRGSRKEVKVLRAAIQHLIKPYPKRKIAGWSRTDAVS